LDRLFECALFVGGLIFGSFLNVCISRIPRDQSIVSPRSRCPHCGRSIAWYDNIPLLSWFILRRQCRACGEPISVRYPAVELLTGILFVACYRAYGNTWLSLKAGVFCFLLIGLIFMDAETGLLPREFTYTGILLGLAFSLVASTDYSGSSFLLRLFGDYTSGRHGLSLVDAILGTVVGAGFYYLTWAVYYLVRKKHGLGFGDIALMGMSGAFLGLKMILLVIVIAPLSTIFYVLFLLVRDAFRSTSPSENEAMNKSFLSREIPFGAFLGGCSLLALFAGEAIWNWYLGKL
jgi:leader peptidase (prepilin peptidase)/N-methyltransferase